MVKTFPIAAKSNAAKSRTFTSGESHPLVTLGLFCGIGLLLSVLAVIAGYDLASDLF